MKCNFKVSIKIHKHVLFKTDLYMQLMRLRWLHSDSLNKVPLITMGPSNSIPRKMSQKAYMYVRNWYQTFFLPIEYWKRKGFYFQNTEISKYLDNMN